VMNDEGIKAAISTPSAEARFNSVIGDSLEKMNGSPGGMASLFEMAGQPKRSNSSQPDITKLIGNQMPNLDQVQNLMQQMTGQQISQKDLAQMMKQFSIAKK